MAECYLCCKIEKRLEEGCNQSTSRQFSQSEWLVFAVFRTLSSQNNKLLSFDVLLDASGPVCLRKTAFALYFRGILGVQRNSDTLKTLKSHLVLNKAQATTWQPSKTFFSFLFFFLSSIKQMLFGKAVVVAKQLLKSPSEA